MKTKPSLTLTNGAVIVSVWHYSATYCRKELNALIIKYFVELAPLVKSGAVDFDMMYTFYQADLIDIIDDCITYYDLEPITIEQI
jgi:hypothetical protein